MKKIEKKVLEVELAVDTKGAKYKKSLQFIALFILECQELPKDLAYRIECIIQENYCFKSTS